MACSCISKKLITVTLWITIPILALSIVIIALFPTLYVDILNKELTLQKGTIATEIWQDIPIPIYERLYFFNITNKEEFLSGREPLNVSQVGPYVYKSKWIKPNPEWNSNNTVSYRESRIYQFMPHLSNGSEDDVIYSLNGPMIIAASIVKDYNIYAKFVLSALLGILGEDIVIERSVKTLAYGGYEDMIIKVAPILVPDIPYKDGIFSWLYGKNVTDDGLYTVFTGADDSSKTDLMSRWNGESNLKFWKGDTCNMLNGTNIEVGPPVKYYGNSYVFFQSIFCRSLAYNYSGDVTHLGIRTKRFVSTYDLFANSSENPDNYCFEVGKERPSGVLDVSPCQFGAPVFISNPHFYMADPYYLSNITGLSPNQEDHGSLIDIEILSGFTVYAKVRMQFNVEIRKVDGILQTYNVTKGIFPVLWAEVSVEIDQHFADYFRQKTENPKTIAYSVLGALIGVCFTLMIACFVILCIGKFENDDDEPLLQAIDEEYDRVHNSENSSQKRSTENHVNS